MSTFIDRALQAWLDDHPKIREWVWFAILWLGGLFTAVLLAYPIKLLIRAMA